MELFPNEDLGAPARGMSRRPLRAPLWGTDTTLAYCCRSSVPKRTEFLHTGCACRVLFSRWNWWPDLGNRALAKVSTGDSQRERHGHVRLPFVRRGWRYAAKHHSSRTGIPACKVRRLRHRRCNQATVADGRIFRRTNHGKSADTTAGCWHPRGARPFDRRREQPAERSLRTVP